MAAAAADEGFHDSRIRLTRRAAQKIARDRKQCNATSAALRSGGVELVGAERVPISMARGGMDVVFAQCNGNEKRACNSVTGAS
jgi:hypothetical protein